MKRSTTTERLNNLQGILLDLDGVLYVGDKAIEGAADTVARLKAAGLRCRFITNTSTVSREILVSKLRNLGFDIGAAEIFSAPRAAVALLRGIPNAACYLLVAEDVRSEFQGLREVDLEAADYIVLGDVGRAWSHDLLNSIFSRMVSGTRLIAIHKNRFWQTEAGLTLDIGGLVTALEYCSGVGATVVGKPSTDFFRLALSDMGLPAGQVAVVGDDVESDVGGGQRAGLFGVLVRTGKFRRAQVQASLVDPDLIIESVSHLLPLLGLER